MPVSRVCASPSATSVASSNTAHVSAPDRPAPRTSTARRSLSGTASVSGANTPICAVIDSPGPPMNGITVPEESPEADGTST